MAMLLDSSFTCTFGRIYRCQLETSCCWFSQSMPGLFTSHSYSFIVLYSLRNFNAWWWCNTQIVYNKVWVIVSSIHFFISYCLTYLGRFLFILSFMVIYQGYYGVWAQPHGFSTQCAFKPCWAKLNQASRPVFSFHVALILEICVAWRCTRRIYDGLGS